MVRNAGLLRLPQLLECRDPPMKTSSARRSAAFTLVELLVVIGIISILIALLIPVLSKMRESAKQVTCSNNLRTLGQAMIAYASENDGYLPATSQYKVGDPNNDEDAADWVYWQPDRAQKAMDPNALIRQSALSKYLSLSAGNTSMLRCPSDNVEAHPGFTAGTAFPYSYVMNCFIAGNSSASNAKFSTAFIPYAGAAGSPAVSGAPCHSLHKVRNPSQKVLMYEQAEVAWPNGTPAPGIDDGDGCPWYGASTPPSAGSSTWSACAGNIDLLSIRHDPQRPDTTGEKSQAGNYDQAVPFASGRGNVVFCDGHADFVARSFLHEPEHTLGSY